MPISLVVLALEVGVVAAIGVGLSGLLTKPILSIVVTYLVVAALSIGTLIAFSLLGLANTSEQRTTFTSTHASQQNSLFRHSVHQLQGSLRQRCSCWFSHASMGCSICVSIQSWTSRQLLPTV